MKASLGESEIKSYVANGGEDQEKGPLSSSSLENVVVWLGGDGLAVVEHS